MILDPAVIRILEKVHVLCKEKVIVQFTGGTRRDLKKTLKLPIAGLPYPSAMFAAIEELQRRI
jgi:hypothetical protein